MNGLGYTSFAESMRSDRGMDNMSVEFEVEDHNEVDDHEEMGWSWSSSKRNEPSRKRKQSTKPVPRHRKQSTTETDNSLELRPFNPEDYEYDYLLRFKDPEVEKEYLINAKKKVIYPVTLIAFVLFDVTAYIMRMPLHPQLFNAGPWTIAEFLVFAFAYIVFLVVVFAHLGILFGFRPGSRVYRASYYIICETGMENLFCVMVTIPSALGMVARSVYGKCLENPDFWDTMICNIDAPSNAVPADMIMLTFLSPVASFIFLKGVHKETIIILWVVASGSLLGCIIYLRAWFHIWTWVIPTVITPVMAYEYERNKIAFFLQTRKMLEDEKEKRLKAERERQEQERLRLEADAAREEQQRNREMMLEKLPVHRAIVKHSQVRTSVIASRRTMQDIRSSVHNDGRAVVRQGWQSPAAHKVHIADAASAEEDGIDSSSLGGGGGGGGAGAGVGNLTDPRHFLLKHQPSNGSMMTSLRGMDTETGVHNDEDVEEALEAIRNHLPTARFLDFDGKTAFKLAQELKYVDPRITTALLIAFLPIDPETGDTVHPDMHGYSWHQAVQQDKNARIIGNVLNKYPHRVQLLASSEDSEGRQAINIASAKCKTLILQCIYLYKRYEIKTLAQPHHQSATCIVHLAVDHNDNKREVALKLMKHKEQYDRELEVRWAGHFSDEFIMGVIRSHDGDTDEAFSAELHRKGFQEWPYCIVMDAGSRSLADVIVKEHISGDWDKIRSLSAHVARALQHMHWKGFIHGDLKPLNIMRVQHRLVLIDLDASVPFNIDGHFGGMKFSSAYIAPEMVYINDDPDEDIVCVRSPSDPTFEHLASATPKDPTSGFVSIPLVPACPAQDLWSLGVLIYQLAVQAPLFLCDVDGNGDRAALRDLAAWSDTLKVDKLKNITDKYARNLVSQLLTKDPSKRLSADRVLAHPFISGKSSARLIGEPAEFDVFISYRVDPDAWLAELVYRFLVKQGVKVWWDKESLEPGKPWEKGFCRGLVRSRVFLPIITKESLAPFARLGEYSNCDNVLLEYRLALELSERGLIERLFPLFLGRPSVASTDASGHVHYDKFFFRGAESSFPESLPACHVGAVEKKLRDNLEDEGQGMPLQEAVSVTDVVKTICGFQGALLEGNRDALEASLMMNTSSLLQLLREKKTKSARVP